jgi:cytidine deaminase
MMRVAGQIVQCSRSLTGCHSTMGVSEALSRDAAETTEMKIIENTFTNIHYIPPTLGCRQYLLYFIRNGAAHLLS